MKLKYKIEYLLLRTAHFIINLMPLFLINLITLMVSWLAWVLIPFRINVAYDNLTTVFPNATHSQKLKILRNAYNQFVHAAGLIFVIRRKKVAQLIDQAEISIGGAFTGGDSDFGRRRLIIEFYPEAF